MVRITSRTSRSVGPKAACREEDEEQPISSHSQGQLQRCNMELIEKAEELPVPFHYNDGNVVELEKNNKRSHQTERNFQGKMLEVKNKEGEHQTEVESICAENKERIVNSKMDVEEGIKKSEGDEEFAVFIKTEAVEVEVSEGECFGCDHFGEEREAECELKEDIYSEHPSHFLDEEVAEMENKSVKEDSLNCTFCLKEFKYRYSLVRHLRIHTGERPFKCNLCAYSTPYSSALKLHIHNHSKEKAYKCSNCDYSTSYSSNLRAHIRIHTAEKPFKCNYCEYSTSDCSALKTHLRRHTGEKPYKCSYCDYSTSYRASLKTHIRRHNDEKPYKCNICEYSTSYSSHLKSHIRTHTAEKPYKCNFCEYSASESSHLIRHNRKHTGEKPFKCNICEYRTSDSSHLNRHIYRKHTEDKSL